ncbi:tRNA uridine-5-carboxymethylaminomethyl(34) synthesis GTPase MnmE [bacterium]|nr:tRNA uridine-5-carboxymethylaminomethyl(34) synthesis GTPase MnmE [bacterium]
MLFDDTIVAVSTPAGPSALAIVRLSGPHAFRIVQRLAEAECARLAALPSYSVCETRLRLRPDGPSVPAALYLMPGPRSYTRDDVAEIHTLGAVPLVRSLLDACVEGGARLAEPGEFTRRAFLSGRISLAQAEGVLAAIQAASDGELRAAMRAVGGEHSRHIHALHGDLLSLRAQVEASIDFAQHDIELVARDDLIDALRTATDSIDHELANADAGALPPEGVRVALCGLPNAGKSSLFNALLGHDRAIVTHIPGTTRDAVAEPLVLDGVRLRLYDTAGLFDAAACEEDATDGADAEAVARARGLIAGTHIAVVVVDAAQPLGDPECRLWDGIDAPHKLLVFSKADLPRRVNAADAAVLSGACPVLHVSAATGQGMDALGMALVRAVKEGQVDASPTDLVWNARHRAALRRARHALRRAQQAAESDLGAEFVAADLREAHDAVGAITGEVVAEDILDVIFAEFCIGK